MSVLSRFRRKRLGGDGLGCKLDFDSLTYTNKSLKQFINIACQATRDNPNKTPKQIANRMMKVIRRMYEDGRLVGYQVKMTKG